ncbi:MAG TPA: mycothiol synthase [Acidimicrobiia bacterium]|nr:mycothiol synthase [Acidimicrobiia bacterium]
MPGSALPSLRPADLEGDLPTLNELMAASQAVDGLHPPGEHQQLSWAVEEDLEAQVLVLEEDDVAVGYAALISTPEPGVWNLELGLRREWHRSAEWGPLLQAAVREVGNRGGKAARLWPHLPEMVAAAQALGFVEERRLLMLRRSLDNLERAVIPEGVSIEHFFAGEDEVDLARVTTQAFAGTAEQWIWTPPVLAARQRMTWFDPADLITACDRRGLLGFCWVKWNGPDRGEIYLLAVQPQWQGRGLGRGLALSGLQRMVEKGAEEAFLYVDDTNQRAITLYQSLNFGLDHVDVALLKRW